MTYRDPTWGFLSRVAFLTVLLVGAWFAFPSSLFFKPLNMAAVKDSNGHWLIISERLLPFGAVSGKTQAFVQVLGREDGPECQWMTESLYIPRTNNVTRYDVTEWAGPCLDAGPPISVRFTRTVYLFNLIPLRPVHYSFMINPETVAVISNE